jgi:radical SAM superfamily enzyme YgiQ (UPF0313 family)
MRVLMISSNRIRQPVPVLPFGACLVAQAARLAGHEVRLLDLMFAKDPAAAVREAVTAWRPDATGVSIRNIDTNDIRNPVALIDEAAALVATVRQNSAAPVVVGGAALGVMPRQILARTGASWAVTGDGDRVFPTLLAALAGGHDPAGIAGVIGPGGPGGPGGFDGAPASPAPAAAEGGLADCTVEDFAQWVDVRAYLSHMAAVPVQAKRGCPFECIYCTYNLAEGRDYRLSPPSQVVGAILGLARQGVRDVEFVDNVFNSPYEHALAICRGLAAARPGVRLQSLELNPRFLDDALLTAMEAAGFVGIGVTVESAAHAVLSALRKGYGPADVRRAAEVVARHRLPCIWIFMLGAAGETRQTVRETLAFAATAVRPTDVAFFQIGTRIYPGTALEPLARRQGVLTAEPDAMLQPVFYVSPDVPLDWLEAELASALRGHLNFISGDSLHLPLLQTVLRVSWRLGVRPPLWRHTSAVRRTLQWLGLYRPGELA